MTSIRGMDSAFILRSKSTRTVGYNTAAENTTSQEAKRVELSRVNN
jgi:hypothetical protein